MQGAEDKEKPFPSAKRICHMAQFCIYPIDIIYSSNYSSEESSVAILSMQDTAFITILNGIRMQRITSSRWGQQFLWWYQEWQFFKTNPWAFYGFCGWYRDLRKNERRWPKLLKLKSLLCPNECACLYYNLDRLYSLLLVGGRIFKMGWFVIA